MGLWLFAGGLILRRDLFAFKMLQSARIRGVAPAFRMILLFGPPLIIALGLRFAFVNGPDLDFVGVGASSKVMRWYIDRGHGSLPIPKLIMVPDIVWQAALLAWATFALLAGIVFLKRSMITPKLP